MSCTCCDECQPNPCAASDRGECPGACSCEYDDDSDEIPLPVTCGACGADVVAGAGRCVECGAHFIGEGG